MSETFFSFVLPAYKATYLDEALKSILGQSYTNFELIVVDDASMEDIKSIVDAHADARMRYYRNEQNIGGKDLVAQWNHCLQYAKGDYVILATDDDLYDSQFLQTFATLIEAYPEVNLFRARTLIVDSNGAIKDVDKCYKEYLTGTEFWYQYMHGFRGGIPQYIFKRDALNRIGGFVSFPLAWGSDDATSLSLAGNGVVNSQEHLVRFRFSDINISSDRRKAVLKFLARLLFSKWMLDHAPVVKAEGEWGEFYHRTVTDYMPIYIKITLISTLKSTNLWQWIECLPLVLRCEFLGWKDKISILGRSL
jgi:glycosyltransferase involved in cell wall biosynthesis